MSIATGITQFWQATCERAAAEPLDATCERLDEPQPYGTYRVSYRSLGGVRVTAKLGVPVQSDPPRRLPAIITAPGYGGWEFGQTLSECQRGYIMLQIYPRLQGESGETPRGTAAPGPGWLLRGWEQPEGYFYQGAFMDMSRGIDYLLTRADVDPARIGAMGTSQGGGIVLSTAAIDPRISAVVAHVPFFCDLRHHPAYVDTELATPQFLATFDYFDPAMLADRLQAPTLLSSGGKDATCPPATIRAVFDRLAGIKGLLHYPDLTHTSSIDFYHAAWEWMARYL